MFLFGVGLWFWISYYLGRKIPSWFNFKREGLFSALLIPLIAIAPFADEIIGRYQFKQICERYAKVQVGTPNQSYTTLTLTGMVVIDLTGVAKPTRVSVAHFSEIGGKKRIRSEISVSQSDQWILRWLGLGANSYCEGQSIGELSPKEGVIRTNKYMEQNKREFMTQQMKSSLKELSSGLNKFDISKE